MRNPETYYYETPMWGVRLLCVVAIAVSLFCVFTVVYFLVKKPYIDWPFTIMLSAMAIGFGIAGGKPRNWQPWVYFFADDTGLHFPSDCPATAKTRWLTVPWERVGEISKQKMYKQCTGVLLQLLLEPDEIDQFFQNLKLTQKILGQKSSAPYFSVGYCNDFKNTDDAVEILNSMKQTVLPGIKVKKSHFGLE